LCWSGSPPFVQTKPFLRRNKSIQKRMSRFVAAHGYAVDTRDGWKSPGAVYSREANRSAVYIDLFLRPFRPRDSIEIGTLPIGLTVILPPSICLSSAPTLSSSNRRRLKMTLLTLMYGPAARCKRLLSIRQITVLHQCIRPLLGACAPGHHGYQRACHLISGQASTGPSGSPVFACAGKTDPPSSSHPLADLGGQTKLRHR
jgi:hypothetical protein